MGATGCQTGHVALREPRYVPLQATTEGTSMTTEALQAQTTVPAPASAVFGVLTDPANHAAIDGTGWVCEPLDGERLTASAQVFLMGMYHPDHPNGHYETANQVKELDPPHTISWATGTEDAEGRLSFGGWVWRYDFTRTPEGGTQVRLTYDWSRATPQAREAIGFPPFGFEHLATSLHHLATLATALEIRPPRLRPHENRGCGGLEPGLRTR